MRILKPPLGVGGVAFGDWDDYFPRTGKSAFGCVAHRSRRLNELGDYELPTTDDCSRACGDKKGGMQVLFWNRSHAAPEKRFQDQILFARERPALWKGPVTTKISGHKPANYKLVMHGTGYERNGACTQYLERGAPDRLTRRQQNELANLAADAPLLQETVTVSKDGNFSRVFDLRENDVCFVIFTINRSDRPPSTLNNL